MSVTDARHELELTHRSGGFDLEAGGRLASITVSYESWGTLAPTKDNAVLILHALTGDTHAASSTADPSPGWWEGMIGPGAPIDTDRFFVVCPNNLGGCTGTTGPSSPAPDGRPYGSRFPTITIRDQVMVEALFSDLLGIDRWYTVMGGSVGGMRALEWCVMYPTRVKCALVVAAGTAATAEQIALCSLQIRAIEADPAYAGGDYYGNTARPTVGLAIARGIGQLTYRTAAELEARFGNAPQTDLDPLHGGDFAVESYLAYQGKKLVDRFDANSYVVLSRAANLNDLSRGRGSAKEALAGVTAMVTVAGIESDRIYPIELQEELVALLPNAAPLQRLRSLAGHDGFLIEFDQVAALVRQVLES